MADSTNLERQDIFTLPQDVIPTKEKQGQQMQFMLTKNPEDLMSMAGQTSSKYRTDY